MNWFSPFKKLGLAALVGTGVLAVVTGPSAAAESKPVQTVTYMWGSNPDSSSGPDNCNGVPCYWTPTSISGLTGVTAVTAGYADDLALRKNGTVMAWGDNDLGELGDGTTSSSFESPVKVSGLKGVTAVAAGYDYNLALLKSGVVMAWGDNGSGELGDGTSTGPQRCIDGAACSTTPVQVPGLTGVKAITAGNGTAYALLNSGIVMSWGYNEEGELGIDYVSGEGPDTCGTLADCSTTPVPVVGISHVAAIASSANSLDAFAISSSGTVDAWGYNQWGELGVGGLANLAAPVAIDGLTAVKAIAAGGHGTMALLKNGTVEAWGGNWAGELGDGSSSGPETVCSNRACSPTPVIVPGLVGVKAITASALSNFALLKNGTVEAWGENTVGELGDGTATGPESCSDATSCSTTPVQVPGLADITLLGAGADTILAST